MKTRLARAIGAEPAAELYAELAFGTVRASLSPGAYRTAVWYDPPEAGSAVRRWLRGLAIAAFHPQRGRGLGRRMSAALTAHFHEAANRVVLAGSDCPGVTRSVILEAFDRLQRSDLVLGPTVDGGYYLLGLAAPAPGLFRGVAWSTPAVLEQTARNARRLGLRLAMLPCLRDLDTVEDARALGLLPPAAPRLASARVS